MPINPFVDYKAPELYLHGIDNLGAGLNQFGSGLFDQYQKEREKRQKEQRELAHSDMIMNYARTAKDQNGQPLVSEDEFHAYQQANSKGKKDIAFGQVQGFLDRMQMQQQQQQQQQAEQLHTAQIAHLQAQTALANQNAAYSKSLADNPFYTDAQGNPIGMKGARPGTFRAMPGALDPQKQMDTNLKRWGLKEDQLLTQPSAYKGDAQKEELNTPFLNQQGDVYFRTQNAMGQSSYRTVPKRVWDTMQQQVTDLAGRTPQDESATPKQTEQAQSKYTPQQLALAAKAIADPVASIAQKRAAQAILADAAGQ